MNLDVDRYYARSLNRGETVTIEYGLCPQPTLSFDNGEFVIKFKSPCGDIGDPVTILEPYHSEVGSDGSIRFTYLADTPGDNKDDYYYDSHLMPEWASRTNGVIENVKLGLSGDGTYSLFITVRGIPLRKETIAVPRHTTCQVLDNGNVSIHTVYYYIKPDISEITIDFTV